MPRRFIGVGYRYCCLIAIYIGIIPGCNDRAYTLYQHQQTAASGGYPAGRKTAASGLMADWKAERITLDAALDHAHALLEAGRDETAYAGAVLDMAEMLTDKLPKDPGTALILNRRIARLAYRAAETAALAGRMQEAESLVLAGPRTWQNEAYWLTYPDHDALVSLVWAQLGRRNEAIARLGERGVLNGEAEEAYKALGGR